MPLPWKWEFESFVFSFFHISILVLHQSQAVELIRNLISSQSLERLSISFIKLLKLNFISAFSIQLSSKWAIIGLTKKNLRSSRFDKWAITKNVELIMNIFHTIHNLYDYVEQPKKIFKTLIIKACDLLSAKWMMYYRIAKQCFVSVKNTLDLNFAVRSLAEASVWKSEQNTANTILLKLWYLNKKTRSYLNLLGITQ